MNLVLKILKNIVIGVWIIAAIFVTICLLSYNEYNITVINKNSFLIIENDELEPKFKEGELVIVKRESDKKINVGDEIFFYNGNKTNEFLINVGKVTGKKEVTSIETTYEVEGQAVSGSYVIGKVDGAKIMPKMGTVLNIVESRWGFMFLIILPTLFATVYEISIIVEDVKKERKEA